MVDLCMCPGVHPIRGAIHFITGTLFAACCTALLFIYLVPPSAWKL